MGTVTWEKGEKMTLKGAIRELEIIRKYSGYPSLLLPSIDKVIETLKTDADRHGHWIEAKYPLFTCSECGATYQDTGYGYNYCPNCGAKMDGACGRWHKQGDEYRCSECGDTSIVAFKKCPNCGANMEIE